MTKIKRIPCKVLMFVLKLIVAVFFVVVLGIIFLGLVPAYMLLELSGQK